MSTVSDWDVTADESVWHRTVVVGPVHLSQTLTDVDDLGWVVSVTELHPDGVLSHEMTVPDLDAALNAARRHLKYLYKEIAVTMLDAADLHTEDGAA